MRTFIQVDYWKPYIKQPENKTMNVSISTVEALARLEAIEAEQKELRKLLESSKEEEAVGSLLESNELVHGWTNFQHQFNYEFGTIELAESYSKAFETFIKLRQCKGSEAAEGQEEQWMLEPMDDTVHIEHWNSLDVKIKQLSPCFSTEEYAQAAIESVGEENILQMFKTFSHYEG